MSGPGEDRPTLLFACFGLERDAWLTEIARQLDDVELRVWPEIGDPSEIDYVLAWRTPPEVWSGLTRLKAIFSLGAGVDGLLRAGGLPRGAPLVSMSDPSLITGMREYLLARVLNLHRQFPAYAERQGDKAWRPLPQPLPEERTVGVMGLGRLGGACALSLAALGFAVSGWSRRPREVEGVRTFAGWDQLEAFAATAEILICLLPLTPETEGVLNRRLFDRLPRGAHLINVGRGGHLDEEDLIEALASGQLAGATLDVFRTEPLPAEHAFWRHPQITVTPHVSAVTHPRTATASLAAKLRALERGEPVEGVVDPAAGY